MAFPMRVSSMFVTESSQDRGSTLDPRAVAMIWWPKQIPGWGMRMVML